MSDVKEYILSWITYFKLCVYVEVMNHIQRSSTQYYQYIINNSFKELFRVYGDFVDKSYDEACSKLEKEIDITDDEGYKQYLTAYMEGLKKQYTFGRNLRVQAMNDCDTFMKELKCYEFIKKD
jgi:hypothetical protein